MKRFFGMMPSSEVAIEKKYKDKNGFGILIQAGKYGWTIIWADNSSNYDDIDSTAEENFNVAYDKAVELIGSITECS